MIWISRLQEYYLIRLSKLCNELASQSIETEKLRTMKTFQSFQKNAAYLGVDSNQIQKSHLFNIKNVFGLSVLGFATTSNIYFLCTTTESLNKNMFSLYMASMSFGTFLTYAVVVWKMKSLFKFVSDLEKALDSSELKYNFNQQNSFFNGCAYILQHYRIVLSDDRATVHLYS